MLIAGGYTATHRSDTTKTHESVHDTRSSEDCVLYAIVLDTLWPTNVL